MLRTHPAFHAVFCYQPELIADASSRWEAQIGAAWQHWPLGQRCGFDKHFRGCFKGLREPSVHFAFN